MELATQQIDRTGRENVEAQDLILPSLSVLQGMSDVITKNLHPDARVGMFFHSGAQEVFKGPVRVLICAHTKSNALFPKADNPKHAGLETCISRDGVRGTVYGDCSACPHLQWGEDREPPVCSESHNFTVLTSYGPAVVRFARTSYKAARNFLTTWTMSPKPLWAHPAVITQRSQSGRLKSGKEVTYFSMELRWQPREDVPPAAQAAARAIHEQVTAAHEAGKFGFDQPDLPADL